MGLERSSEIAATSVLLSSYTEYLSIIEQKNNILFSEKRGVSHDTSKIRKKIDALEKRLESLVSTQHT
jgi:hypothetical protein